MRPSRSTRLALLPALAAAALAARPAAAADRLPFRTDLSWDYESTIDGGVDSFSTFFETRAVEGGILHVLHAVGGENDGLEQRWTENGEHDKFLEGFTAGDLVVDYVPPILWIDEPLSMGRTWDVATTVDGEPFELHFAVTVQGPVQVPAGTFDIFGIESSSVADTLAWKPVERRLDGRRCGRQPDPAVRLAGFSERNCYADGTGLVLSELGTRVDRLARVGVIDAVEPATWTRVRLLYR